MPRYPLLERRQKECVATILINSVPPSSVIQYTTISRATIFHIHKNLHKYNIIDVLIEHRSILEALVKVIEQALISLLAYLIKKLIIFLDKIA